MDIIEESVRDVVSGEVPDKVVDRMTAWKQ